MKRKKILILFFIFLPLLAFAQAGREFWFAVPEVTSGHADRPVYLRVFSVGDEARLTLSVPASATFQPLTALVPANGSYTFDLTPYLSLLECAVPNIPVRNGLLLQSDVYVTAYYEVIGNSDFLDAAANSDLFSLKGPVALGKKFYTPFQTTYPTEYSVGAWKSIDIVATEDGTTITITPSNAAEGHPAGVPFTVILNRGETFSLRSFAEDAEYNLAGTYIESDKPIAVTVKDDSVSIPPLQPGEQFSAYDLQGDQIVPIDALGKNYFIIKGEQVPEVEQVFVLATEDNTEVFKNGVSEGVINRGVTLAFNYDTNEETMHITTNNNVYVWHVSGYSRETGAELIPPIRCAGSRAVQFYYTDANNVSSTNFINRDVVDINIIVPTGGEDNFVINGSATHITAADFTLLPGSNDSLMYARISFGTIVNRPLPAGPVIRMVNSEETFFTTINIWNYVNPFSGGPSRYTSRYGSLSGFAAFDLGPDVVRCYNEGSTVLTAPPGYDTYFWSTGATDRTITVAEVGSYVCTVFLGPCSYTDTLLLTETDTILTQVVSNPDAFCFGSGTRIVADSNQAHYLWNTGDTTYYTFPQSTGTYSVTVTDVNGCQQTDTVYVVVWPLPEVAIQANRTLSVCAQDSLEITITVSGNAVSYLWHDGETDLEFYTEEVGTYWVEGTSDQGCTLRVDASVYYDPACVDSLFIPNIITPNGDGINDFFVVPGMKLNDWRLRVFNRWGAPVYDNKDYDNTWDGEGLTDGVYYFSIEATGRGVVHRGWVMILRR